MKPDQPNNEVEKHKYERLGFAELVSKRRNLSEMEAYPGTEPKSHERVEPIRPGRADGEAPIDSLSSMCLGPPAG